VGKGEDSFPHFRELREAIFRYPICCAYYVNLPPCSVPGRRSSRNAQASDFILPPHQGRGSSPIRGQTTLLVCNRPCLPYLEPLGFTDDREMVL
jgi:hypothetical protein